MRLLRVIVAVIPFALVVAAATARADNPVLTGDVGLGDAYVISFKDAAGNDVTHLDPGTYTIVVHDRSAIHNFHLLGPGANAVQTPVGAVGDYTFTVTLGDGTYKFVCDVHSDVMTGTFTVGTGKSPAPPPAERLAASVGPGKRIALRNSSGAAVVSLPPATYVIVVRDNTKTENFHLRGPGVSKATGVGFRGTATWRVTLSSGAYTFRSDHTKKLSGMFLVQSSSSAGYP